MVILPSFFAHLIDQIHPNIKSILKSSYNRFKYWHSSAAPAVDCQLLVYSAIFMVTSTTICVKYKAQTMCKTRIDSQGMILNPWSYCSFSAFISELMLCFIVEYFRSAKIFFKNYTWLNKTTQKVVKETFTFTFKCESLRGFFFIKIKTRKFQWHSLSLAPFSGPKDSKCFFLLKKTHFWKKC